MNYPILAAQNTWFAPTVSTVTRASITEIEIMDSYTPDSSVTVVDSWDASAAQDGSITCYVIGTKLIIAGNGSGKIAANEDSSCCFGNLSDDLFSSMASLAGTNLFDTSEVVNMAFMFCLCVSLTSIDVSTWNVSKVTDMQFTFALCNKLTTIRGLSNWDVSKVTNMNALFGQSGSITSLDLSNWDTSSVTNMASMFELTTSLTSLDLSNWDVSKVSNMRRMFRKCAALTTIGDLSNWNVSNVKNMVAVFVECTSLNSIGNLSKWNISKVTSLLSTFEKCENLTDLGDLSNWNTSSVTEMIGLFSGCTNLQYIGNISNWDISNVVYTKMMFQECSKLTGIGDLANWDTSSCTDMSFMFWGASSIKEIDVTNWDVSKVTTLDHFAAHAGLRRKGIENWNTSSLVNANAAFHNCTEEELDLSGWDVSKVEVFSQMFENSPNLKRIKGLENWNTSAGWDFSGMFERCYALEELDLSSFDTSKAKNGVVNSSNEGTSATLQNMFLSCNNLKKVTVGPNFSINGDGTNTAAANMAILPTPSADYIAGADGMWYTFNGDAYAPDAVKDRTYNTYYASKNLIHDLSVRVNNGTILDIVNAIREKVPNLEPTLLSDLDDIILSKVFEPVLEVDEEGNAIITATALSIDKEGNATVVV